MREKLIQLLEPLGHEIYLHGTIAEDEAYPDSFITFLELDSPDAGHFDNKPIGTAWEYQIIFYSTDPEKVLEESEKIRTTLRDAGWIPQGKGRDIPSDEPTHTGKVNTYLYLEMEE